MPGLRRQKQNTMPKKLEITDGKLLCPKCGELKNTSEYYLYNGHPKRPCIECKLIYQNGFWQNNKESIEEYRKKYYFENRESIIKKQIAYDKTRILEKSIYQREYSRKNKNKLREQKRKYRKNKVKQNPWINLKSRISNAVYQAIKDNNGTKGEKSILKFLPYTMHQLKEYIESKFESWMNWNNWGSYRSKTWNDNDPTTWVWQIDHIIPQSDLPYKSMQEENFQKCWALSNLRPYSAKQNVTDGCYRKNKL